MNKYRVDRASSRSVPCGMGSIRYIGDSWEEAVRTFRQLQAGLDAWNQPNPAYGVILSVWKVDKYTVKLDKGL